MMTAVLQFFTAVIIRKTTNMRQYSIICCIVGSGARLHHFMYLHLVLGLSVIITGDTDMRYGHRHTTSKLHPHLSSRTIVPVSVRVAFEFWNCALLTVINSMLGSLSIRAPVIEYNN